MSGQNYTAADLTLVGADHIAAYRSSGGEVGYLWNGAVAPTDRHWQADR